MFYFTVYVNILYVDCEQNMRVNNKSVIIFSDRKIWYRDVKLRLFPAHKRARQFLTKNFLKN